MIDAIKRAPGKYNYASVGSGSPHHLFMEALKTEFGLEIQHVPYKGTPAAITDLLSGQVQLMFADATLAVPNIQAGKVVALGTSAAKQTTLLPAVPPVAATVPGFDWQAWQGIVAPAGTPAAIVDRLAAEMQKIQATPEFREQLLPVRHGALGAEHAGRVRGDHPRRPAALGEGRQGLRRQGRLSIVGRAADRPAAPVLIAVRFHGAQSCRVPSSTCTRTASPRRGSNCCSGTAVRAIR